MQGLGRAPPIGSKDEKFLLNEQDERNENHEINESQNPESGSGIGGYH
jgi:hypothetical protein